MLWLKKQKKKENIAHEKSELAKSLGIRIATPYGYYPDDVDGIIGKLQGERNLLSKEKDELTSKNKELSINNDRLKSEITKLKMEISTMEIPLTTEKQDLDMTSKLTSIANEDKRGIELEKKDGNVEVDDPFGLDIAQ